MNEGFHRPWRRRGISIDSIIFLLVLLHLPALGLLSLSQTFDLRWILGYGVLVSAFTFLLYREDKQRAQAGEWRTPEATLHFAELLGGWPGAFLAQRVFRHKTSKRSYQATFWLIVALHEYTAFDFVQNWQYSKAALLFLLR